MVLGSFLVFGVGKARAGTVTLANTKLSLVNGTAFVDLGATINLAQYPAGTGIQICSKTNTSECVSGYVQAAGTGETYGSNLLSNPAFTSCSGTTCSGWTSNQSTITFSPPYAVFTAANGSAVLKQTSIFSTVGALYFARTTISSYSIGSFELGLDNVIYKTGGGNNTISAYVNHSPSGNGQCLFLGHDTTCTWDLGTMLAQQVLSPSTSGVTIVSTLGGSMQNWATNNFSTASSWNDSAGYTYTITAALTSIGATTGSLSAGSVLTAGTISPSGATVSYQWQSSPTSGGSYTPISGATSSTYTLQASDIGNYIEVVATGTGTYTGTETSSTVGPVTNIALASIGTPTGTAQIGDTLTSGAILPSGATASYQWQWSATPSGVYANISGATSSTYVIGSGYAGGWIEVTATGTGSYSGTVASAAVGPVMAGTYAPCSTGGGGLGICYVDTNSSGGDGTTQATTGAHAAFAAISTINSYTYEPGDQILFAAGDIWRGGELVPSSSGSSGNPIIFGSYGGGSKPIISGADLVSGWTADTSNAVAIVSGTGFAANSQIYETLSASVGSQTLSYNSGSTGSNRTLAITLSYPGSSGILAGITYGGVTAVEAPGSPLCNSSEGVCADVWYVDNPPTGSNNIVVTWNWGGCQ